MSHETPATSGAFRAADLGSARSVLSVHAARASRPPRAGVGGAAGGTDRARDAAERFVSLTLVEPILKQMRESNHAAPPFGPAPGESQFRALLDAEVARQVVRAGRFPLVERVARDLREAGLKQASLPQAPENAKDL